MNAVHLKQHWGKIIGAFFVIWGVLHLVYYNTAASHRNIVIEKRINATLNRIALDIPELKLADQRFNQAVNTSKVSNYIRLLNEYLEETEHPIRVIAIQDTLVRVDVKARQEISKNLLFPRQTITIKFAVLPTQENHAFYLLPLAIGLILTYLALPFLLPSLAGKAGGVDEINIEPAKLILDLTTRTLYLNHNEKLRVPLANKPFCFYLAMLDFCANDKNASLFHNKTLPEDFLNLTNKYFTRLMDLGHTKRKRPDFTANIDKMLSEIRNALDEVLENQFDIKVKYYPKKAQGEGSRSKLNNFALIGLSSDDYELIGK